MELGKQFHFASVLPRVDAYPCIPSRCGEAASLNVRAWRSLARRMDMRDRMRNMKMDVDKPGATAQCTRGEEMKALRRSVCVGALAACTGPAGDAAIAVDPEGTRRVNLTLEGSKVVLWGTPLRSAGQREGPHRQGTDTFQPEGFQAV